MSNRTAIIGLGCVAAAVSSSVVLVVSFVAPGPLAVATAAVAPALFIGVWFVLPFAYRRSSWSADTGLTGLRVGASLPVLSAHGSGAGGGSVPCWDDVIVYSFECLAQRSEQVFGQSPEKRRRTRSTWPGAAPTIACQPLGVNWISVARRSCVARLHSTRWRLSIRLA